jgi:heme-degrading monooxygenase HmoA
MMAECLKRDPEVSEYHLAQLNIAQLKYAFDAPELTEFVARFEEINALADDSPGFVWRLQTEDGDATAIDYFGPEYLVNMSVWEDVESLHDYVYRTAHNEVMARRKEWFERMLEVYAVLWWIPAGTIPTVADADQRLQSLRQNGPTAGAFTFKQVFPPE